MNLDSATRTKFKVIVAFAAVYLIWGSTYLGIRYAVESIPPFLMMGMRHLSAGIIVYAWDRRHSGAPTAAQWGYAAIGGAFLFMGCHGLVAWAEKTVPSGLAALLSSTLPLWTVMIARMDGSERKLNARAWTGILLGFAGVACLIGPAALRQHSDLLPAAAVVLGTLLWAAGTSYSRSVSSSGSSTLTAAMQMITGGAMLLIAGKLSGEGSILNVSSITLRSATALAYLIVFGSVIAFTAFSWLVTVSSPSHLSTFAYVNPVVAIFLGWALAAEQIGARTLIATLVILAGVALVSARRSAVVSKGPISEDTRGLKLGLQNAGD